MVMGGDHDICGTIYFCEVEEELVSAEFGSNRDAISFIFGTFYLTGAFFSCERDRVRLHQENVFDEEM